MILIQVTLPHLCAGVIANGSQITQAAPVLAWSIGKSPQDLAAWVIRRGGRIAVIERFRP